MDEGYNVSTPTTKPRPKKVRKVIYTRFVQQLWTHATCWKEQYLFIDVVSTFLRTIRTGAIWVRHGAVVLAHYGRLVVVSSPPPTYFNNTPSLHESTAGVPAILGNLDLNHGFQAGAAIDRDNLVQAKPVAKSLRTMHGDFLFKAFRVFFC